MPADRIAHPGGIVEIGYEGEGFFFDNECPRHEVLLRPFSLEARLPSLLEEGHLAHLDTGVPFSAWGRDPLTANAYLGGFGIAAALKAGADIVITGRVVDASLASGAAAWWWSWSPSDYEALAGTVAAGHVIECGAQATGGNFSGWLDVVDLARPGLPLAEISQDGSAVITEHAGTGGAVTVDTVTVDTVTAQLLYEIGEPAYLNPDVVAHLDTACLYADGVDRVGISGVRGSPPPKTTKVAITSLGGWRNSSTVVLTGLDIDEEAATIERSVRAELDGKAGTAGRAGAGELPGHLLHEHAGKRIGVRRISADARAPGDRRAGNRACRRAA